MLNDDFKNWLKESAKKYKQDISKRDSYPKIKELYDDVISDYLSELKDYSYTIYQIKEYQQVIVFDCGEVTYFGIEPELFPVYYYENDELYKLCSDYNIIHATLITSSTFKIPDGKYTKKYEWSSKLFKYYSLYPSKILDYQENDNYTYNNRDAIELFNYVDKELPELNLKERYLKHQKENMSIEENVTFKKGLKHYKELFDLFINDYLSDYSYRIIDMKEYEKIIIIENNYVLFYYMTGHSDKLEGASNIEQEKTLAKIHPEDAYLHYHYIIQELTYNDLFKFNRTKFYKTHQKEISYISFDYADYQKDYFNNDIIWKNRFTEVDKKYPELKIQERFDNWEGIQYYFIVYELTHNGVKGTAVTRTTDSLPSLMGRTLIKEYENYSMRSYNAFSFDDDWFKCMNMLTSEAKETKWQYVKKNNLGKHSLLAEKVEYYVVPIMLKDTNLNSILEKQKEVLNNAVMGKYKEYEKFKYDIIDYKWKSEELMFECVKKVFKTKKVYHQYRPYFLHTRTGQLSYDVFVFGLNIAFEYQGKQHYEPVELFGGEENFKRQQERDEIKRKLSKKNGIKLIYINYWENITTDLIKEKIKDLNIFKNQSHKKIKNKDIIKYSYEEHNKKDFFDNVGENDDYDNRILTICSLNCIELNKENIHLLTDYNILFIEDDESDGSMYFMDENKDLFHINVKYNKDKSINKNFVFLNLPEYKKFSFEKTNDFKVLNLGMGHSLLIKSSCYDEYIKLLNKNIKYENGIKEYYNLYCYWMKYAIEFLSKKYN